MLAADFLFYDMHTYRVRVGGPNNGVTWSACRVDVSCVLWDTLPSALPIMRLIQPPITTPTLTTLDYDDY